MLSPISYALQRGISLRRENPTYWAPVGAAMRGFKMVLFTASRRNNFLGVTCPLPSTLLVFKYVATLSNFVRYARIAQLFCKSLELNRFAVHYLIPRICKIVQLQRMSRRYVESPFTSPRRLFYSDCSECLLSARSRDFTAPVDACVFGVLLRRRSQ